MGQTVQFLVFLRINLVDKTINKKIKIIIVIRSNNGYGNIFTIGESVYESV